MLAAAGPGCQFPIRRNVLYRGFKVCELSIKNIFWETPAGQKSGKMEPHDGTSWNPPSEGEAHATAFFPGMPGKRSFGLKISVGMA